MTPIPINDYAPGGRIYNQLVQTYGIDGAERVFAAAKTGDREKVSSALSVLKGTGPISSAGTSTLGNFFNQITTDPLAAPLESANNQIGKAVLNVLKNPWVLLAVAGFIFYQLGGFNWAKRKLGNA